MYSTTTTPIAFDIDQVIVDSTSVMKNYIKDIYGTTFGNFEDQFEIKIPGLDKHQVSDILRDSILENSLDSKPLEDSIEYLNKFYEYYNYKPLVFITARDNRLESITHEWLDKYLNVPYFVYFDSDKIKILKKLNIKYFVDDKYETIINCASCLKKSFLYNQSWNVGKKLIYDNIIRINSLKEVYNYILNIEN